MVGKLVGDDFRRLTTIGLVVANDSRLHLRGFFQRSLVDDFNIHLGHRLAKIEMNDVTTGESRYSTRLLLLCVFTQQLGDLWSLLLDSVKINLHADGTADTGVEACEPFAPLAGN
ncbi:hypothetical protein TBK1r_10940 [Stieleria magnilauensis]|uniref:Uncharacterized protein n=1 Tax=Stieleria magnilauensis TaxID=2527963 RepID=A0ABX5XJJ9_9BACT|nr:hypothetical protein TBK1r_10940 [Planctomycetes bacterium TBK1r]